MLRKRAVRLATRLNTEIKKAKYKEQKIGILTEKHIHGEDVQTILKGRVDEYLWGIFRACHIAKQF